MDHRRQRRMSRCEIDVILNISLIFAEPNPVTNVTVLNRNTTSVTLSWVRPIDHKPRYRYRVETRENPSSNSTVTNESITVAQLDPGTRYTFSVFTLAADGTLADPVTISLTTGRSAAQFVFWFNESSSMTKILKNTG